MTWSTKCSRVLCVQFLFQEQPNLGTFAAHALFVWINSTYKDSILSLHTLVNNVRDAEERLDWSY